MYDELTTHLLATATQTSGGTTGGLNWEFIALLGLGALVAIAIAWIYSGSGSSGSD